MAFADELLEQRNAGILPVVTVEHPLAGISPVEAEARVTDGVIAAIVGELVRAEGGAES